MKIELLIYDLLHGELQVKLIEHVEERNVCSIDGISRQRMMHYNEREK